MIADYDRWLNRMAMEYLPINSPVHDDLVQEGRIAMWRAMEKYDETKGSLPSWLTKAAKLRMRDVAHGHGQWMGHQSVRGTRPVETISGDLFEHIDAGMIDEPAAQEPDEKMPDVRAAVAQLPEREREYVALRFFADLDPSSRQPEMKRMVEQHPVLKDTATWRRARTLLREALAPAA